MVTGICWERLVKLCNDFTNVTMIIGISWEGSVRLSCYHVTNDTMVTGISGGGADFVVRNVVMIIGSSWKLLVP